MQVSKVGLIYKILCLENQKCYVGMTVQEK
jgi:hypothetical protein